MNVAEIIENQGREIQALKAELNTYQKRCEQYTQAYDQLQHQLKELLRNRFGKKSERFIDPENPQSSLFGGDDKFSVENAAGESITKSEIQIPAHSRKKKNKSEKNLPRRIEIIPLGKEEKMCPCGACKEVISYETKESLHHQPAIFEIVEQRREIAVCPKGCDGSMITAPAPLHILPKIKATEDFLSFLVVSKMDDRQPLYHLEKQLSERHGIDCSRQTMARWVIDLMIPLQPVYNLMKEYVIDYDVASCDATTLQVLNEPGRSSETKSYVYCIRGGSPDKSVILYDYNDKLHKQFVKNWFEEFKGYLHVDGDNFFELVGEIVNLVNCNAHARRKFEPVAQGTKGRGLAKEAMRFYKELYKIEREAKNSNLTSAQRYELRQKKSKPLMEKFKAWLDEMYPTVLPKSPLGLAMSYCINRWPGLTRFLDDGRLEIDNNLTEQAIKPLVIARKNFLFCYSVNGAKALCMHFGFIRTAKLHGHDPYHYYVKLLKGIPHCKSVEDYEKLLPWNLKPDYIKQD
ncbi:MAG: transposase IS66 [uncultured bacterium]|nr:MAG: transposase IS66 [uncultured bacterium]